MYECLYQSPLTRLSDDQIEHAIESALARGDTPLVCELVDEIGRRGHDVDV